MVSVLGLVIVVCSLQAKGDACGVLTIIDGKDDGASLLKKTISAFKQKCRAGYCVDSANNYRALSETWLEKNCDECICTTDGPSCSAVKCEKGVMDFPGDCGILFDEYHCCPIDKDCSGGFPEEHVPEIHG